MSKQQQRAEETRSRILKAAQVCFAQNGFDATGVAEICRAAGLSKGAFYHHFASKQEVFLELLNDWLAGLDEQMMLLRNQSQTVPEGLQSMAGLFQGIFQSADQQLPIFLEFWSRAARDPEVWQATIGPYHRYRDYFASMVEAGIAEDSLQPSDPQTTARIIVSLAVGLLIQGLLDPEGADWDQVSQDAIKILLGGLIKK